MLLSRGFCKGKMTTVVVWDFFLYVRCITFIKLKSRYKSLVLVGPYVDRFNEDASNGGREKYELPSAVTLLSKLAMTVNLWISYLCFCSIQ